ncbi:WbqC family protein [Caulobacter mirabilis]|uniref:WbqC family protein n=1 Tax=Caulobacter mirabilis TaxID=69666 RepID=A0A2D2AUB6_9CAUL|nr:WbqC family protein [Caulobacter mirabilis]ATQ41555.1 hypothetical protein CSW64_03570 [Caulobacter mirabilis]
MTRTAVISQPTWLPYLGYFELIAAADVFVFLDDVQFARRSWQSRNRIPTANGELMLTVPVRRHDRETLIRDIEVDDGQPWRAKQLTSLRHAYAGRPFFAEGMAFMEEQLARPEPRLSALSGGLIEAAARRLGLETLFVRASDLDCDGARSEHLLALCRRVGADRYLSTGGSADYMAEDGVFEAAGFPVVFRSHQPRPYPQGRDPFVPYMAFVDALMNLGWDGLARHVREAAG